MVNSIASLATTLSQHQLAVDVGAKLLSTAQDAVEEQGEALVKLLESAKMAELQVNPHLGSMIDVRA